MKALIFDLGKVLIDFDHRIAARRIANFCDRNEKEIFEIFFDSEITGLFEEGKISPVEFYAQIRKFLNLRLNYAEFVFIWNEIFFLTKENREVYYLALRLKEKYQTALLSNINILHLEYVKKTFPVFDAFHLLLASCELKLRKPEVSIYRKAAELLKTRVEEIFYTDDRLELVENARQLGINGFLFKDIRQLKRDLESFGIEVN
jgi:FMN phosphatase YigB (HAD superfamily)